MRTSSFTMVLALPLALAACGASDTVPATDTQSSESSTATDGGESESESGDTGDTGETSDPTDTGENPPPPACDCAPDELCVGYCTEIPSVGGPSVAYDVACVKPSEACANVGSCGESFGCFLETCGAGNNCDANSVCGTMPDYDVQCGADAPICAPGLPCAEGKKCGPAWDESAGLVWWCGAVGPAAEGQPCTVSSEGEDSCKDGSICWDRALDGDVVVGICTRVCAMFEAETGCSPGTECVHESLPDKPGNVPICR